MAKSKKPAPEVELIFTNSQEEVNASGVGEQFFRKLADRVKNFERSVTKYSSDNGVSLECKVLFKINRKVTKEE